MHIYIIGHYNASIRITFQLLTPLMLCALILYMKDGTYSLTSTPYYRFLRIFFIATFLKKNSQAQRPVPSVGVSLLLLPGTQYLISKCKYFVLLLLNLMKKYSRRGLVGSVSAYQTKSQGSSPRPDIKTKYEKYFFGDFLSADFWQKL